ncbi:MAG: DUF3644 domain-containing protein [bacterium]
MNLKGSYRALRNNSKAAMLAAIEIYNKPQIEYRDECFSILLINAWELLLKAILSKNGQRIFYPKERNKPYRTVTIQDALTNAKQFFPSSIPYEPVAENIRMLTTYRNNAIHFYNQPEFGIVVYGLSQTSIINYRDLLYKIFSIDIANEMSISLLPLSFGFQPDPIEFLKGTSTNPPKNKAVAQFLREVSQATNDLESKNFDTSRFLTVFQIALKSVKKVSAADVVVGIKTVAEGADPLIVERRVDPNISHPLRQKEILRKIGDRLNGVKFTSYTFQALVWKHDIKSKPHLYWRPVATGASAQYSNEVISLFKNLSQDDIKLSLREYRAYQKRRSETRKRKSQE